MSGPRGIHMSGAQVIASVLATLTGAIAASYLGVGGTLVGAAVGSLASTMGTEVYKHYLLRSQQRLRAAGQVLYQSAARTRTGNTTRPARRAAHRVPGTGRPPGDGAGPGGPGDRRVGPAPVRRRAGSARNADDPGPGYPAARRPGRWRPHRQCPLRQCSQWSGARRRHGQPARARRFHRRGPGRPGRRPRRHLGGVHQLLRRADPAAVADLRRYRGRVLPRRPGGHHGLRADDRQAGGGGGVGPSRFRDERG